jgi:hypothetical protein
MQDLFAVTLEDINVRMSILKSIRIISQWRSQKLEVWLEQKPVFDEDERVATLCGRTSANDHQILLQFYCSLLSYNSL